MNIDASIQQLIDNLHLESFPEKLLTWITTLVPYDSSSVIAYGEEGKPQLLYDNLQATDAALFYARFVDGAYTLSPSFQAYQQNISEGFYQWSDIQPDGFKQSTLFKRYYSAGGIADLGYYFLNLDSALHIQICIGRHQPNNAFSASDCQTLKTLEQWIIPLARQHWRCNQSAINNNKALTEVFRSHIDKVMKQFGDTLLTDREQDIARLIITGHSSQSAASQLHITPGTERVHRSNLYAKLTIKSSAELFGLFMQQLAAGVKL